MNPPIIDLTGLTRRPDLERSVDLSPVAIAIYLLILAGLGLAGWSAVGGFTPSLFTAGAVLLVLGLVVAGLYMQFVKFDCPECGRRMSTRLADMEPKDVDPLVSWGRGCFHANGHCYGRSLNEDDCPKDSTRHWVRLMRRVVICETCDLYAVIGEYVEMELSPDELLEFDSRYVLSPDVVAQLREGAEDGERSHEIPRGS
jgi:hypothetical protein